jgi:hypothetical protein
VLEFGATGKVVYPAPGFSQPLGAFKGATFAQPRPSAIQAGAIFIRGKWIQDAERIATSDPTAEIVFLSPTSSVSVVAQALGRPGEVGKLVVELSGSPVLENFAGLDLGVDDEGQSNAKVHGARLYHLLSGLPGTEREVTFRFPAANRVSVAIYGLRFIASAGVNES